MNVAFVSMKELLQEAKEHHYAIGQFNINGLQWTKAILEAAEEERSPVIAVLQIGSSIIWADLKRFPQWLRL